MALTATGVNGNPFRTPQLVVSDSAARTDTAVKAVAVIPKRSRIYDIRVENLGVASDAGTTAVIDAFVTTSTSGQQSIVSSFDAKQGAGSYNVTFVPRNAAMDESDTTVSLRYTETGTASTTGGPWRVIVEFYRL